MPGQQGLLCLSLEVSQVGDGAGIAMGQGLMHRLPTEEPHPSHQPSLHTAPGASAATAGPPPQKPGPRGGAGIGHLAGPRGAAQAPTGERELASCLFFKQQKKRNENLCRKKEENKPDDTASNSNRSVLTLLYIIYISDTPALASP